MNDNGRKKRQKRRAGIFLCSFLFLLQTTGTALAQDPACEELALDNAAAAAIENNPNLAAIRARYTALAAVPEQQSALPDPVLSFGALNLPTDSFDLDQENMTQMQIGLSQKLPFPGKLRLKEESAAFEAEAALGLVDEAQLSLVKNTKKTWWDIFYLQKSLTIIRSNQDLLRSTVSAARTKYMVGKGLQQDVLLAQLELTKLIDREMAIVSSIEKKKAVLTALLDRQQDAGCISIPSEINPSLPEILPLADLQENSLSSRPGLLALQKKTEAAQSRIELARKDYYPDFTVGAAYGYRQDSPDGRERSDLASIKFSMNIPIWTGSKQDNALAQRTSESLAAKHKVRAYLDTMRSSITSEFSEYASTSSQSELYATSLIPQAEQTAAAMLKGYQVNKVDFLNVIRAQLALYNYKITYWHHLSSAFKALAGLEAATGSSIFPGDTK